MSETPFKNINDNKIPIYPKSTGLLYNCNEKNVSII